MKLNEDDFNVSCYEKADTKKTNRFMISSLSNRNVLKSNYDI